MIGLASGKDTSDINKYFKMDQGKVLFPFDLKFYLSKNPYRYDPSKSLYELHAIKVTTSNKHAPLDGSVIISAKPTTGTTEIAGDFTIEEASDLANILKSGELPFELKIVEAQY